MKQLFELVVVRVFLIPLRACPYSLLHSERICSTTSKLNWPLGGQAETFQLVFLTHRHIWWGGLKIWPEISSRISLLVIVAGL